MSAASEKLYLVKNSLLLLAMLLGFGRVACTAERIDASVIKIHKAVTGKLVRPLSVRFTRLSDEALHYRFTSGSKEFAMIWPSARIDTPYVLMADLNFDGYADLWLTGWVDGHGRVRKSAVWLFNSASKSYELHSALSGIANLEVEPDEKWLQGGMTNCGCAGGCYFFDTYVWQSASLVPVARREQQCADAGLQYREWALVGTELKVVHTEQRAPTDTPRANERASFIKWSHGRSALLPFDADSARDSETTPGHPSN